MSEAPRYRLVTVLCLVLAVLIGITAGVGVFLRGDLDATEVTSIRGETYRSITDGIYRYNSERMVAEGVGWDIFTLLIALPVFFVLMPFLWRGSLRARLLAVGLLAYFFYQYLMYSLAWAFGPLFIAFVFIYAGSLYLAVWIAATIDRGEIRTRIGKDFPRRGVVLLCALIALMLILMWAQRIMAGLNGDWETAMLLGQTTMVIQALDLGLVVPFALLVAYLVWKNRTAGFLLSPILMVKGAAMAGAISVMLISAWVVEGNSTLIPLLLFVSVFAATLYLGYRMLRSV